jgi:hypothetical protein
MAATEEITNPSAVRIPVHSGRGEIWFSINLGLIQNVPKLYELLKELGFHAPKLAYKQYPDGEIEIHLLLHHETRLVLEQPPDELYWEEQMRLANEIDPEAITLSAGIARRRAA